VTKSPDPFCQPANKLPNGSSRDACVARRGGKLLADRSLSRLLRSDWPRTLDELETLKRRSLLGNTGNYEVSNDPSASVAPLVQRDLPTAEQERVMIEHLPIVRFIARRIHERLPQHVLMNAGFETRV
jgi:hypothetical protein